jgi:hypothetical protein
MSPRFPSPVIDQMLARGQITRVAPNRAQSDQLLTQAEAHLRSAQVLRDADTAGAFVLASALDLTGFSWMRTTRNATEYGSDRHPSATAVDVDEATEMATTIHQRAGRVLDHMYPY